MKPLRFVSNAVRHAVSSWGSPQRHQMELPVAGQSLSIQHHSTDQDQDGLDAPLNVTGPGMGLDTWAVHAWLQWLPLTTDDLAQLEDAFNGNSPSSPSLASTALQLGPLDLLQDVEWDALRRKAVVYDPFPERIEGLREQKVAAQLLSPTDVPNGWLKSSDKQLQDASEKLGLPPPQSLLRLAEDQDGIMLCLGSAGEEWEAAIPGSWLALPAFDDLVIQDWMSARSLACWLNTCCRLGLQLVRIHPRLEEFYCTPYRALVRPKPSAGISWITPPMVWGSIQPRELAEEVSWLRAGRPIPEIPPTPQPVTQTLWANTQHRPVRATICVSLHNYADRIIGALDSCLTQTEEQLELLIIDDASEDDSVNVVQQWLDHHGSRFVDARLLSHPFNCGLAAARNSAFSAAKADWCFVLDADNQLERNAVRNCLKLAMECSTNIAVVHPLVALKEENRNPRQQSASLLTRISWQKQQFLRGNLVDAMALIRKSAWERVGGFTHIPGGWEDFDFWCKLIEAGFGGVLCPQKLAVYNRHQNSMQSTQTIQGERTLKRILKSRHPWLKIEDEIVT